MSKIIKNEASHVAQSGRQERFKSERPGVPESLREQYRTYSKIEGKNERTPLKMMPRRVENGAKMAPKWLPGGLWAPTLLPEARRRPLERLWGGSWGRRGASWGAPGASWAAPGAHFGSPGASFWSFLALREVILEGVFATGACNAKKCQKL